MAPEYWAVVRNATGEVLTFTISTNLGRTQELLPRHGKERKDLSVKRIRIEVLEDKP